MMTTSNQEVPWVSDARSAWLDTVRIWLHEELCGRGLVPSGEVECVHEKPWAIVLRVSTPQGFVYFKASGPGGRHEPGLVTALAQRWSDRVPAPLAIDRRCGWMLLRDYGRTLRHGKRRGRMHIAIGSDHAGFRYKECIRALLTDWGHNVTDFSTYSPEPVDYPLYIRLIWTDLAPHTNTARRKYLSRF